MAKKNLLDPKYYINRELSWLEFNKRVLNEGLSEKLPLLERCKFLAIVSSNFDEFFLIRVAGLLQQKKANLRKRDMSGLTPTQQLDAISECAHVIFKQQSEGIRDVFEALKEHGLSVCEQEEWTSEQQDYIAMHFNNEIIHQLTPLSTRQLKPFPEIPNLQLCVAVVIGAEKNKKSVEDIILVPVPKHLPRFLTLPAKKGTSLVCIEEVIKAHVGKLFESHHVLATTLFRITRDADVSVEDDEAGDLLETMEEAVIERSHRSVVRLEIDHRADKRIRKWLTEHFKVRNQELYEIDGLLDATCLWQLVSRDGFDQLKVSPWKPQPPRDLIGSENIWETLQNDDVLLFHPFESFEPVVQLVEEAANDPTVLSIKQTLYRTSGDSPVVAALEQAAQNGKQVTVLLELKARFDEAQNIRWAKRLEDAGCLVIYGIAGFKTHAKALLIVRRESTGIRRYAHLATGNYNDKTARLYTDMGIMTTNKALTSDVSAFFNLLTGYSEDVGWSELIIAPTNMRRKILELIDREIQISTKANPGCIMFKINSLHDEEIAHALYRASKQGVNVLLNVRGICCLRPGLKKISDNITVRSIVDTYLEHARIFYFANGGHEEIYMSSADLMTRNLDKRLELLFPILSAKHRKRLKRTLDVFFSDNVKAYELLSNGTYERIETGAVAVRAQEYFNSEAIDAAKLAKQQKMKFRPLRKSK